MKELKLTNSHKVALVDDEDYPILSRLTCSLGTDGYARCGRFRLHQLICGFPRKKIDHADRNRLNLQKDNLRLADDSQNAANSHERIGLAGFRGVTKMRKRWMAQITIREEHQYLGTFDTSQDAAIAYDKAARLGFGEFAYQNFPEVIYAEAA